MHATAHARRPHGGSPAAPAGPHTPTQQRCTREKHPRAAAEAVARAAVRATVRAAAAGSGGGSSGGGGGGGDGGGDGGGGDGGGVALDTCMSKANGTADALLRDIGG